MILLYGPFGFNGEIFPESNQNFDRSLKNRDPSFGIRDFGDVEKTANKFGFDVQNKYEMPANNFCFIFKKLLKK